MALLKMKTRWLISERFPRALCSAFLEEEAANWGHVALSRRNTFLCTIIAVESGWGGGGRKRLPRSADPRLRQQKLPTKLLGRLFWLLIVIAPDCVMNHHYGRYVPTSSRQPSDLVINLICLSNINFPVTYFIHLSSRSQCRSHSKKALARMFSRFFCASPHLDCRAFRFSFVLTPVCGELWVSRIYVFIIPHYRASGECWTA